MFYILRKINLEQVEEEERVMFLADFNMIQAGTKGRIIKIENKLMTIHCDKSDGDLLSAGIQLGENYLEYLGFETPNHPWKMVNRPEDETNKES